MRSLGVKGLTIAVAVTLVLVYFDSLKIHFHFYILQVSNLSDLANILT